MSDVLEERLDGSRRWRGRRGAVGCSAAPAVGADAWCRRSPTSSSASATAARPTEFNEFAALTGKHPALLETFHPWGNSLNEAYERWRETGDAADPPHLDRRRPDAGGADHPGADRARRRRRLPAAAQRLLRQTRAARLHPAARRAEPLPQRLVGGQLRRQPERRRTHRPAGTSRPSAGSPRSSAAGRPWKGSTRPWPKSACRR